MSDLIRFGVSIDADLLSGFDKLCTEKGYENRSEAIRDLIRQSLVERNWRNSTGDVAATLTLVYDHHKSDLAQKMAQASTRCSPLDCCHFAYTP